jgi:N-acetylglucosamine malate deacetylase 1
MNIFNEIKNVLVLAPHTDDGEFGCGGTISYLVDRGVNIYYAAFSACQQSVLPQYPADILVKEVKLATAALKIPKENLFLYEYEVRTFSSNRQLILDEILKLKSLIKPDLIFIPSVNDIHQDHATISNEAIRAFKFSTILCYEIPWNNFVFTTSCFFHLEEKHIQRKIDALAEYVSQAHRPYANENFIRSLATTRGVQSGTRYAEVFELIRLIIK